jgi:ABC-2 type transport system permease protein
MLKVLVKKEMAELFRSYFYNAKKNKARSKGATAAYFVLFALLMAGILGGMFAVLAKTLCAPLHAAGVDWLYFAMMGLIARFAGGFRQRVQHLLHAVPAKGQRPAAVFAHSGFRANGLPAYDGLPHGSSVFRRGDASAILVYWIQAAFTMTNLLGGLLLTALISVFVMTVSCALGFVVAKISLKLKRKSLITVIVSLVFFAVYYFVVFKAQTLISQLLSKRAGFWRSGQGCCLSHLFVWPGGRGRSDSLFGYSLVVAALFALMWALISRSFFEAAASTGKSERKVYKETAVRQKSVSLALLGKEFSRFPRQPQLYAQLRPGHPDAARLRRPAAVEGRGVPHGHERGVRRKAGQRSDTAVRHGVHDRLYERYGSPLRGRWRENPCGLMQSLPVKPWQALRAKLSLQLLLTGIPMLFCLLCLAMVYPFAPLDLLLAAVQTLSFVMLSALFGLFMGLKMPNLNWTQEITVIKQSMGVMIAMFGGWAYTVLFCMGFLLFPAGSWALRDTWERLSG